jgi:hypothetical protein
MKPYKTGGILKTGSLNGSGSIVHQGGLAFLDYA